MMRDLSDPVLHPSGDQLPVAHGVAGSGVMLDSFTGSVPVEWDHAAAFTPLGQSPFFIDFLKTAGLSAALREPERAQEA